MGMSVAMLAYQEEENLKRLLPQIHKVLKEIGEKYEIIVVDTAQPLDNTAECCRKHHAIYVNQTSAGFGGAYRTAIDNIHFEKALFLDSDGSHDPRYIKNIYRMFMTGQYDVVVGSRYVKGGKTNDSRLSVMMSLCLNLAFRVCLGLKARDLSTNFRMYHTDQLRRTQTSCVNYDVLEEILVRIMLNEGRLRIGETPISFEKRFSGESKRKLLPFIRSYLHTLLRLMHLKYKEGSKKNQCLIFLAQS